MVINRLLICILQQDEGERILERVHVERRQATHPWRLRVRYVRTDLALEERALTYINHFVFVVAFHLGDEHDVGEQKDVDGFEFPFEHLTDLVLELRETPLVV